MKKIKIGRIVGAAGLRGEVKLYHDSGDTESLSRATSLFLCDENAETISDTYDIVSLRVHGRTPIIGFVGITDRNAAEALIGKIVFVDEDAIRPTEDDAYLVSDLISLSVLDVNSGEEIGRVSGIVDNPAHDLLEVTSDDESIMLIPMADVFIKEINLSKGHILAEIKMLLQSE